MTAWLTQRGFDADRMVFAGRTAVTACFAFVLAWTLGLEHPQWAAITVWAASQPTRGQLLEKSFFRISGTVIGTIAGVLLVVATAIHPALLVIGLALWVGACTFLGNLQRGFVAYGTVLAGYTAASVALLDTAHPDQVAHLGADRLATALLGVLAATMAGYFFARPLASELLRHRMEALLADLLVFLTKPATEADRDAERTLLSELTAIEEALDPYAAGSFRSHRKAREARGVLIAAIPLLLWRRGGTGQVSDAGARAELAAAAAHLRRDDPAAANAALDAAAAQVRPDSGLDEALADLGAAISRWRQAELPREAAREHVFPTTLDRDWVSAREAMWRASGCLFFFGLIWLVTGWQAATFMLLGLSILLSLHSTKENPARIMRSVLVGQVFGVLGALICRWLVWPLAGSEWQMVLFTLPFILFGPLLAGHRRTVATSTDYNMVVLLLLQPQWPMTESFGSSLTAGLALIAAPLIAIVAYNYVYPPTLRRRLDVLLAAMLHDLADLAADPAALGRRAVWLARLYYRALRLIRLSVRSERTNLRALDATLAFLNLGHAAMRCHELLEPSDISGSDRRAIRNALARIREIDVKPDRAKGALKALGRRLGGEDAALLQGAAAGIANLAPFFPRPTA